MWCWQLLEKLYELCTYYLVVYLCPSRQQQLLRLNHTDISKILLSNSMQSYYHVANGINSFMNCLNMGQCSSKNLHL
ncbi:UNKNOWN [Stylonychia lemnae]|uniref:Uncharacterized protein n=1 Tax=Stylonychia lemnae TaxID=5949 RepID=A0A078AKD9_STYLE|nr:UNKNOWN [Stylonychia lemnae]|eukprot:CDW81882.1 UNKNOWN [Stylonychia lemnae]